MSEKAETNELTTDKANSENCANTSGAKVHQEKNSHSDDSDSDSDNNIDDREIEQIEQEILGVKSMLRRYCGRHKVNRIPANSSLRQKYFLNMCSCALRRTCARS